VFLGRAISLTAVIGSRRRCATSLMTEPGSDHLVFIGITGLMSVAVSGDRADRAAHCRRAYAQQDVDGSESS